MRKNMKRYYNLGMHGVYTYMGYKYENGEFLITNGYSILKLNNIDGLIEQDKENKIEGFFTDFSNYEDTDINLYEKIDFLNLKTLKKYHYDLEILKVIGLGVYGINLNLIENIYRIIKPTSIKLLKKVCFNKEQYVFEVKNEKTNEVGYLLPTLHYE